MASSKALTTGLAGALFGGALLASGLYLPSIILSQMQLRDFHMLEVFLTASASCVVVIYGAKRLGLVDPKPRGHSALGWLRNYSNDGNIIGGLMHGAGMAITGACPATILVQMATGIRSGWFVMIGGLAAGVVHSRYSWAISRATAIDKPLTLHTACGIREQHVILAYEVICLPVILSSMFLWPGSTSALVPPVIGGLLLGGSQAASLLLTGDALGVSGAYSQAGQLFWWLWAPAKEDLNPLPSTKAIVFATGVFAGSWAMSNISFLPTYESAVQVSMSRAVLGGFIMIFGSRLAGGCTSGHGLSGMSLFSISSIITIASIFVGGIGFSYLDRFVA